MKKYSFFILTLFAIFLFSCVNEEGEGGTAVVDGYIHRVLHPDGEYNFKTDTVPATRANVYIMYGNKKPYGDKMDAGPDGYFRFEYLSKGTYTVFAYDKYPDGSEKAVYETVTVGRGETGTIKDIYIHEGKMLGKSYIKGKLLANYYDGNKLVTTDGPVPAVESRVYIRKKNAAYQFNDVRVGSDGTFMFEKLAVGDYVIFAVSESSDRIIYVEKEVEVTIASEGIIFEIQEPIIIRLRS